MEGVKSFGPYKATKLWNEMVQTFRNGIPLRKHRRHIKVYDNCFTGQEAINWFQAVLQNSLLLGSNVTKEQTIQLLNKFLKAGIYQNVNSSTPFDVNYQCLKEGDLYCLSDPSFARLPQSVELQNIDLKPKLSSHTEPIGKEVAAATQSYSHLTAENSVMQHHTSQEQMKTFQNVKCQEDYKQNDFPQMKGDCKLFQHGISSASNVTKFDQFNQPGIPRVYRSNTRIYSENLNTRVPFNSRDMNRVHVNLGKWVDTEKTCIQQPETGLEHLGTCTTLPRAQPIQRSASILQNSENIKPHNVVDEINMLQNRRQIQHFHSSSSPLDTAFIPNMHKESSSSSGFSRHAPAASNLPLETGDIWKKLSRTRLQKLIQGFDMTFGFDLRRIPGEWLAANASSKVDSQFPQSLVAAMDCLVHWPQAVPNEIITAFKEHYFKFQEPLTTFKLYSTLTKVYMFITTGNLTPNKGMESTAGSLFTMVLPPNSCFETAFTSDSPITRIVPQRSVDTLHFSQPEQVTKIISPKRVVNTTNSCEPLPSIKTSLKSSSRSGLKRQTLGGRRAMKQSSRKTSRRVKIGMEEDKKLCHFRNKSGGYVNPALSRSIDENIQIEHARSPCELETEQELDYVAALESLNTLMRCSRRDTSVAFNSESDLDQSESSSYYTAASSSSSSAGSRRSSLGHVDTAGAIFHMSIGETGEKLLINIMQLLLLCIPVYYRMQLRYLLHFMNRWTTHHSLCIQADVINIFTSTILRSECENEFDAPLARSIVYFLVSHHELILSTPPDLEAEVQLLVKQQIRNVSQDMTYCQQVSNQQFEQQKVRSSQLALAELLEQIITDCKMDLKEKRKRLKMFEEAYPHIYYQRFPDSAPVKKQNRGILHLGTLSRLRSLRV